MRGHIMVIDDTRPMQEMLNALLTDEGYRVSVLDRPTSDVREVELAKPDLIILDYLFEGKPLGRELIRQLKARASTTAIPIILCTAAKETANRLESVLTEQGVRVVLKPFGLDELLVCIQDLLEATRVLPGPPELELA